MSAVNYQRIEPTPRGAGCVKVIESAGNITSQIIRPGYGGPQSLMLFVAIDSPGDVTTLNISVFGRMDDTCPWADTAATITAASLTLSTSNGAATGSSVRTSVNNAVQALMLWPELKVVLSNYAGTGPVHAWLAWGLAE